MSFFRKLKTISAILALTIGVGLVAGCSGQKEDAKATGPDVQGTIAASGSTALLPLLKPAQEEFQKKYPKVTVNIAGGGSFTGQNQVAAGSVNIGNSDVALQDSLRDKGLIEHKLVGIPFIFIVNKDVAVDNLSQQQYIDILTGKITNWKDVGGKDQRITIIHRATSSGSRQTIADVVLKGANFTDNAVIQDSNGAVRAGVSSTPGAIGYVDAAYADQSVKVLGYNGAVYSLENVANGKYPIYTVGRMFTKGQPAGAVKTFIDYVTSSEFQEKYVEKNGFIPLIKLPK